MLYDLAPNIIAFSTERRTEDIYQPYAGFNVNPFTGDAPSHVALCQRQLANDLQLPLERLVIPHQVHGTRSLLVDQALLSQLADDAPSDSAPFLPQMEGVDALLTNLPEVCIGVSTADCVPLLFFDPVTHSIGVAHAGWRGTVARIGVLTVARMYEAFGAHPQDVRCIIGPSIGPKAFEVGDDVYLSFSQAGFPMPRIARRIPFASSAHSRRWRLDLWQANAWQLLCAGLLSENITISGICTHTDYARFFSARRLGISSGRIFSGLVMRNTQLPT